MSRIDDVADKTFTTTRLREGYEITEVDGFRAEVAGAISLRDRLIAELQTELAAARSHPADPGVDRAPTRDDRRESSVAAARLLEMAAVNADRMLAEARDEAASLVDNAHAEAEHLLATSRAETQRVSRGLADQQAEQAAELDHQRTTAMGEIADRRAALEGQLFTLRQLESDHRERMRRHFTEQLALLEDTTHPASLMAVDDWKHQEFQNPRTGHGSP